jgi:AraC-like DNA-binding protein
MAEQTVAAGLVRGLLEFAVRQGAARAALLAASEIDPETLEDADNRLPFAAYVKLMRAGKKLTGDEALSLHFAEAIDLSEVSVVGLLGHASADMMEAFQQLNRYGRLTVDVDLAMPQRFTHELRDDGHWLVDHRVNPNAFPELTESVFTRMIVGTRRFGDTPFVSLVHVTHAAPSYAAEYERIFRAPVVFEADWNAMRTDPAWHQNPIQLQPRYAFGILTRHADAMLKSLEDSATARGEVERLLLPILHTGEIGIDAIAAKLGLSRQTLYRRLKEEGVTFEMVLDDLRRRLALDYLSARKVSVNETAYLVGFSDPAAFSRAFKRWTGVSPRDAVRAGVV